MDTRREVPLMSNTSHHTARHMPADAAGHVRNDWRTSAACIGRTDLFFPADDEGPLSERFRVRSALALCASCPVQALCRAAGRAGNENGIWGGETDDDRRQRRHTA